MNFLKRFRIRADALATRPPAEPREWFKFKAQADKNTAELTIFGEIGGGFFFDEDAVTGKSIAKLLDALPPSITNIRVRVNSAGGSVFDGLHIANTLRAQHEQHGREVNVEIEALAASSATLITSAGTTISMPRNAMMMVHMPFGAAHGPPDVMRKVAEVLDRAADAIVATYRWISNKSPKQLRALMEETTWMSAEEALENGFITAISEVVPATAMLTAEAVDRLDVPERFSDQFAALFNIADDADADPAEDEDDDDVDDEPEGDDDDGDGGEPAEGDDGATDDPAQKATARSDIDMTPEQIAAAAKKAAKKERDRVLGIQNSARIANIDAEVFEPWIDDGVTLPTARANIFEILAERDATLAPSGIGTIVPGDDEHDKRRAGIGAALLARVPGAGQVIARAQKKFPDHPMFADPVDVALNDGGEWRNFSLFDHARASLDEMVPGASRGKSRQQVAGLFMQNAGGYQTTSDFANALENTLNKTLLAAYLIAPDSWRFFCGVGSVTDFRAHPRYRTGYLASLDQIFESGEFTNANVPDAAKESITALTYGNILALGRNALVDDDMSVFDRIAVQLGRAAALTIEVKVYATLGLNSGLGPLLNDGVAMFNAAHSNLGAGAAISIAALDADRVIMAQQKDSNDIEFLDIRPSVLVVPIGLEGQANQFNQQQFEDHEGGKPNRIRGLFDKVVGTPRLSGTRRYMFANPADLSAFEVAFLDGEQEPFMEMRDGWTVDGVEWKVRHDFGVAGVDERAALTDAGV